MDTEDPSLLLLTWDSRLDSGTPYLSHYELGFGDVAFNVDKETHSYTFTGLSQSSSHNLTLTAVTLVDGIALNSSQSSIRVKVFGKFILSLVYCY